MVSSKTQRLYGAMVRIMKVSGTSTPEDIQALSLLLFACAKTLVKTGVYGSRGEALAHIGNSIAQFWVANEELEKISEDPANAIAETVADGLVNRFSKGLEE